MRTAGLFISKFNNNNKLFIIADGIALSPDCETLVFCALTNLKV